jgi:hypothetical protein
MGIHIRDDYLEREIQNVQHRRGDKTVAKTASDLLLERVTQMRERGELNPVPPQSVGDLNAGDPSPSETVQKGRRQVTAARR